MYGQLVWWDERFAPSPTVAYESAASIGPAINLHKAAVPKLQATVELEDEYLRYH